MQIALDILDKRINIVNSIKGQDYFCPVCKESLIQKKGSVNAWHFSHKKATTCDNWYEGDNKWCVEWQDMFPEQYKEIIVKDENESHRADIKVNNLIIKFQNSTINGKEFDKRHNFFTRHGSLVWVINLQGKKIYERKYGTAKTTHFTWDWAYKLNNLEAYGNKFDLFFQIDKDLLVKVIWNKQGYKYFGGYKHTKEEFMDYLRIKYKKSSKR
ncbi:competence protein CoiA family protein [Clostridium beijerinckii]|uniref:competence protein CoiA family protein n=1 Tax=Clostridium beijerinckii TaxID=1520 RepID=UPI001F3D19AD|nr:competence protein CoiA family protein [Clostridium beijerinckii]